MNDDRRRYFRITDTAFLTYRVVDSATLEQLCRQEHESPSDLFTLLVSYSAVSEQTRTLRRHLRQELPAVAKYCDALEKKMDILAKILMLQQCDADEKEDHLVNVSAGGIEFSVPQKLETGNHVFLRILFQSSQLSIIAGGEVARAVPCGRDCVRVAVEFTHIREEHREAIVRHVLDQHAEQIRTLRGVSRVS